MSDVGPFRANVAPSVAHRRHVGNGRHACAERSGASAVLAAAAVARSGSSVPSTTCGVPLRCRRRSPIAVAGPIRRSTSTRFPFRIRTVYNIRSTFIIFRNGMTTAFTGAASTSESKGAQRGDLFVIPHNPLLFYYAGRGPCIRPVNPFRYYIKF